MSVGKRDSHGTMSFHHPQSLASFTLGLRGLTNGVVTRIASSVCHKSSVVSEFRPDWRNAGIRTLSLMDAHDKTKISSMRKVPALDGEPIDIVSK